jgi:ribosomal protein S8
MMNGKPTTMTNTKLQELQRVGFIFSVREGGHTSWDDRLAELVAYQREHGDTLVPKKYPPNPPLGYWVNEQRSQYQRAMNGKSSTMNKKRQENLNAIDFKWSIREPPREFAEWIKLLKLYKSQWGDCNVPLKYKQDLSLGSFVNNARTQYKKFQSGLSSNMTQEKIDQLEELGFIWNIRQGRTPWTTRFEELKQYKERYGHCNVSKEWMENQKLVAWVTKQKSQYKLYTAGKECNLTEEKVEKLSELGLFSEK